MLARPVTLYQALTDTPDGQAARHRVNRLAQQRPINSPPPVHPTQQTNTHTHLFPPNLQPYTLLIFSPYTDYVTLEQRCAGEQEGCRLSWQHVEEER